MRHTRSIGLFATALVVATAACGGREEEERQPTSEPSTLEHTPPPDSQTEIIEAQTDTTIPMDEPEAALKKARDLRTTDPLATATSLRDAAAFIRLQAVNASGEARTHLEEADRRLERLASDAEAGTERSAHEFEIAFAGVHEALAEELARRAREDWAQQSAAKAGQELKAASRHFDYAVEYAGRSEDRAAMDAIREANAVSEKLIQGSGWVAADVERSFDHLERELTRLGSNIRESA
jgi:hypothetical protein